jgi:hypothetical protein
MKSLIAALSLSLRVSFVILGPGVGPGLAAAASPVSVQFVNPSKFTDFQIRGRDVNYTAGLFANSVQEELTPLMKSKYPNGSLLLRFTDVDLAGRYSIVTPQIEERVGGSVLRNHNNINASPTIIVGTIAPSNSPRGEIPTSPNREARML